MTYKIETVKRASLIVEEDQVRSLIGALTYYNSCAWNNFDAGYERGNSEDEELKQEHALAREMQSTLEELLDHMEQEG